MLGPSDSALNTSAVNADLIYIEPSPDLAREVSSIHCLAKTTHPSKLIHVEKQPQHLQRVTSEDIVSLAKAVYLNKGRGITYQDLVKGPYKLVDSPRHARNLLRYHKKKGILYTNSTMTIPQQYYSAKIHAELAYINSKETTHPQVLGFNTAEAYLNDEEGEQYRREYEEEQEANKARTFADAVLLAASSKSCSRQWEVHNIRIDANLPSEAYYHEGLSKIPPQKTKQKPKQIEAVIDDYIIPILIYPNGRVVTRVGTSEKPFPISLSSPERTTSSLTAMVAQIRRVLCAHLSDMHNRIVPPIHLWHLMQMDLNTDVKTTAMTYFNTVNMQPEMADNILLGVYRKMLQKQRDKEDRAYIRVEAREYQFSGGGAPVNESVGFEVTSAVCKFQKKLTRAAEVFR